MHVFGSGLFEDGRDKDDRQEVAQPVLAPMRLRLRLRRDKAARRRSP
ncbi:hypothetical protein [Streptomyces sp. NPDC002205]